MVCGRFKYIESFEERGKKQKNISLVSKDFFKKAVNSQVNVDRLGAVLGHICPDCPPGQAGLHGYSPPEDTDGGVGGQR